LWKGEEGYFAEKFNKYSIVVVSAGNTVSSDSGTTFSLKRIYKSIAKSDYGYMYIDSVIVLQGNEMMIKAATKEYQQLPPVKVLIVGLITSPYIRITAILLGYISQGWEGPPDIFTYRPFGYFKQ